LDVFLLRKRKAFVILTAFTMAPSIDKRSSNNTSSQDAFKGAFLGNLAPLVSLFGEQVSKQFLAQASGIPDCILFAICPVGLLTAVVSVIRLAGSKTLRTSIGRYETVLFLHLCLLALGRR
jgi:hypothetical protein